MSRKNQALIEFENRQNRDSSVQELPADSAYHPLFANSMPVRKGRAGRKISRAEVLRLMQLKDACEGDVAAAKIMLDAILQNEESRLEELPPVIEERGPPSSAAEALLLLGILEVEMTPTLSYRFPDWVIDAAVERIGPEDAEIAARFRPKESQMSHEARKGFRAAVLDLLAKAREPGANRFRKGESGNPRGRPRKKAAAAPHPFLLETVSFNIGGKNKRMTKSEVLLRKLTKLAETDRKIRNLLTRHLESIKVAYGTRLNQAGCGPIRG